MARITQGGGTSSGGTVSDSAVAQQVTSGTQTLAALNAAFDRPTAALQDVLGRLRTGIQSVTILVVSDSTAAMSGSWVDQLPAKLAALYPGITVSYAKWDDTSQAYLTPTTTGTGSQTVYLYNGSWAGKNWSYALDVARHQAMVVNVAPDVILFSHGHNESNTLATSSWYQLRDRAVIAIERHRNKVAGAAIVLLSQNPLLSYPGNSERRADMYRRIALERGYGFIDVCAAFHADGRALTTLVGGDQIHPTAAGYTVWLGEVAKHLGGQIEAQPAPMSLPSLTQSFPNQLPNGDFSSFASPPTLPSWTAVNATLTKDTTDVESKSYSVAVAKTAASAAAYIWAAPANLSKLKGREVTFAVRMFIPSANSANSASTVGQLAIIDGVTTPNLASATWSDVRDQWFWTMVTGYIAPAATSVQFRIMPDPTTGSTLPSVSIDRAIVVPGRYPVDAQDSSSLAANVQTFTANGTWTKPGGAYSRARVAFTSAGGAGGSGRRGASGSVCCGGGGGAHGAQGVYEYDFADLPSSLGITIGAAGTGGAAVAVNDTSGNAGGTGGSVIVSGTNFSMQASGGTGGSGGTATTGNGASAVATGLFLGAAGASASTTGGAGNGSTRAGNASGAAGGGVPTGATFSAGGAGVSAPQVGGTQSAATGGTTDGAAGSAASTTAIPATLMPPGGRSGGGGASSVTGNGGAGGAGFGYGYGGSGGGAALNGANSGAGGDGGPGIVVIVCY